MTTASLPPPDTHCFDEDTQTDVWSYSAPLVELHVAQIRADLDAQVQRFREHLTKQNAELDELIPMAQRLEAENQRLREALREIADDYADRFDLESPSTNPGIKYVIKQARAALEKQP